MKIILLTLAVLATVSDLSLGPDVLAAPPQIVPEEFLFGASTYPELQTREEWNRMLDVFQKARFKVVRVSESSWGNLETAPGKYNFGWLKDYLDDVERHGMKAILGTSGEREQHVQWMNGTSPVGIDRH